MIDQAQEASIAARRSRLRQKKDPALLIRDDGVLYPNTDLNARKPTFRPYYGDPKASLDDRMRFLNGLGAKRAVKFTPVEPFDVGLADKDALLQFALEQYGMALDASKPLNTLRTEVFNLAQLPEIPVMTAGMQQPDDAFAAPGGQSAEDYARGLAQAGAATSATRVRPPKPAAANRGLGG